MIKTAAALTLTIVALSHGMAVGSEPATPLAHYTRASWTETDGSPSSLIWAIAQDRDGYIWLGTDGGLVRFDGVRFVEWGAISPASSAMSTVRALCATRAGELWVGHGAGGVSRLRDGRLTTYGARDGAPERVLSLLEDHEGTVWAGGFSGLSRFRGDRWERLGARQGVNEQLSVSGLFEDRLGTIWISTPDGVSRRSAGSDVFEPYSQSFRVRDFEEDSAGTTWATGPDHAIRPISPADLAPRPLDVEGINGSRLLRDRHGSMWIATLGQGVVRVSGLEGPAKPVVESLDREKGLSSNVVRSMLEDREGNIWIGTQHGLNRLSATPIVRMSSSIEETEGVRAVTAGQDGSVWVATENGLYRFLNGHRTRYDQGNGLPTLSVAAVHSDRHGTVWVATDRGGVARFVDGRFVKLAIPASAGLNLVEAITTDHEGGVWLCDILKGVFRWKDGNLTAFRAPEVPGKMPFSAMTDRAGRVWIGFVEGTLLMYDNGTIRSYSDENGLAGGSVSAIFEDRDRTIWVASDKGLSRFTNGRFAPLGEEPAWTSVRAIVQDKEGDLWFGVGSGIARFRPPDVETSGADSAIGHGYTLYDVYDGLRGVPMSIRGYPTAARGGDDSLWFVTSDGIAVLDPSQARKRMPPPVRIERAVADDQVLDVVPRIRLRPRTSRLQIDYTGFNFSAPTRIQFRYRLEGFDSEWVDAATRRQAFYTNLPPGPYRFHVVAGNDGVWSESSATWEFTIQPAFYQTQWLYVAGLTTLGLALLVAWQLRVRNVKRQFSLVLGERTRVAREIHDTLLQSLVGVAFQFDVLSSELDAEPSAAKKRFERLRGQIEMYIREARQSIWDLRSPTLETRDLATAIQDVCAGIVGRDVAFEFHVRGTPRTCASRVEEALLRIGQEGVSNAVRHADASRVAIELNYSTEALVLHIVDNGRGFDPTDVNDSIEQHWGLASMRERAEQVGGQFILTSEPGRGTEIEIVVPSSSIKGRV